MGFLTVTLNPAIDATYVVRGFTPGATNRVVRQHARAGGKGNNVARVLARLGEPVVATGVAGGEAGCAIEEGLRAAGITPRFVRLEAGTSRTCHTILDEETHVATEVLEAGPALSAQDRDAIMGILPGLVADAAVVVISGSAPPGADPDFLRAVAQAARRAARLVADAGGTTLAALLDGQPDLIKPNEAELTQLMGGPAPLVGQVRFIREDLIGRRLAPGGRVLLSRGGEGALLVTADTVLRARAPAVAVRNTVGCGDALLAGFVAAWQGGASDAEALRAGVATGTAAALVEVAGEVDPAEVARIRPAVQVTVDTAYTEGSAR